MLEIESGVIYLTRGDDATIEVTLDISGEAYEMQPGDKLTLAVERWGRGGQSTRVLTAESTTGVIAIGHELTSAVECGMYDADIQLETWDGKVYTVFPPRATLNAKQLLGQQPWNNFVICKDVCRERGADEI